MEKQMRLSAIGLDIGDLHNSVPRKRFILYQMCHPAYFVPFERFRRNKTAHQRIDVTQTSATYG